MAAAQNSFDEANLESLHPTLQVITMDDYQYVKITGDNQKFFKFGDCVKYSYINLSGELIERRGRITSFTDNSIELDDLNREGQHLSIREMGPEPTRMQMSLRTMELIPCPPNGGKKSKRRKRRKRKSKKH